uniref:Uncharacterized protein LOC105136982 n=1 Tax=Rhizophora mucronata TaxID=61149 RepID=A0A2P2MUE0_RHIMU
MASICCYSGVFLQTQTSKERAFNVVSSGLPLPYYSYGSKIEKGNTTGSHCGVNFQSLHQIQSSSRIATRLLHVQAQHRRVTPSSASINTTAPPPGWPEFARNVSGEWDGFGADFTNSGEPIQLPDSVVPEAYREWEVKVFDWQTQCPTLAPHPADTQDLAMTYKSIKLLPTVGCEADAATRYSVDERNVNLNYDDDDDTNNKASAFAYQSSGSYVAVWQTEGPDPRTLSTVTPRTKLLELEHCLIHPQNRESRVRIFQVVRVANNSEMTLESIRVFCEQWSGPFRNGDQPGGCTIRDSPFASTAAVNTSQVAGVWQAHVSVANFQTSQTGFLRELTDNGTHTSVRNECQLILLPKQLWCSTKESKDGEPCYDFEVGWLHDNGCALTSRCIFSSDGKLKEISIVRETVNLEGL